MSNDPDFVTVRPREVRLSHRGDAQPDAPRRPAPSPLLLAAGLAVIAVLLVVFVYLPGKIVVPGGVSDRGAPAAPAEVGARRRGSTNEPEQAPLAALQSERERSRAQDTLAQYVELQIELEDEMNVRAWAAEPYGNAQALAVQGDKLFIERKYDEAIASYGTAIEALEKLVGEGTASFEVALAEAVTALDAQRLDAARTALVRAATIFPDHPEVAAANARLDRLPKVIELTRDALELRRRGELESARSRYQEALALDPLTRDLPGIIAEIDAAIAERRYQEALSGGYAALDDGRFDDARAAFNRALSGRPDDSAALQALLQVKQSRTLDRIQSLRARAVRHEAEEAWADAVATFDEALAIDATLKFARDGRQRALERAELDRALEAAIARPEKLSSDRVFTETVALFDRGVRVTEPGPRLSGQLDTLERIIAVAAEPVAFTLVSDNATLVTISQVGTLGAFEEKKLSLRPGRYLLIGSRDGCRDVRKEIDVSADMAPVVIRCEERL